MVLKWIIIKHQNPEIRFMNIEMLLYAFIIITFMHISIGSIQYVKSLLGKGTGMNEVLDYTISNLECTFLQNIRKCPQTTYYFREGPTNKYCDNNL
jgi:formate/nitrite transporter FocA (FNT family)